MKLRHIRYILHDPPRHRACFGTLNDIKKRVQIMELIFTNFTPTSRYFLPPTGTYFTQGPGPKHKYICSNFSKNNFAPPSEVALSFTFQSLHILQGDRTTVGS